ncbi:TetR/AcrR family transcriptional regulator [Catellatospora vulcania]|uniref:TetR/AcrR family transcriptional regulator n=1 Tax=Catellatospora vulcania TaxID=1460450 RepID=UPI001E3C77E7|nr:TetR/AcrR family transcriptional regulator [Catellatospora vulcania]
MPKRVDHDLRRRQIGEALLRIASTRGLQAASMREVAAEAGVSLRLVQYYFHTKTELLLGALAYLGEQLSARVEAHIRALGLPPTPRSLVYGTLTAILPTDAESRRLTRTYAAYYALVLAEPALAADHGTTYPDALERFLAGHLRTAQAAGQVDPGLDAPTAAAGLLALTNGLGSSVLGGQRDGDAALAILTYHLDRLFGHQPGSGEAADSARSAAGDLTH